MTTLVVDASAMLAALVDGGPDGAWATERIIGSTLHAPHLLPVELSSVLRRAAAAGELSVDLAALTHADLADLPIDLYPFGPFADRVWELRSTVTSYDAWYVALAESLACPLVTLDRRLAGAPGLRCEVATRRAG
ncbi:MAG: type II toxin-antitoxin system VapC family toxin [Acidimicrobiia bacterium]